jgi:pyridoxal phosphate enzyme (YggS family)
MTDIGEKLTNLRSEIPESVKLIAVSKTKPAGSILDAYNFGQRRFGENRVQELLSKKDLLPADIEWHLIGHLQRNKVKSIIPFISMIQSVDSFDLLTEINAEAHKVNRIVNCLLQIHIATEETKFGFSLKELMSILQANDMSLFKNVRICGIMGMATYTSDRNQISKEFHYLRECFDELKCNHFITANHFKEISMGMSGDYELAVREGSTMVRIGSLIFGERNSKREEI